MIINFIQTMHSLTDAHWLGKLGTAVGISLVSPVQNMIVNFGYFAVPLILRVMDVPADTWDAALSSAAPFSVKNNCQTSKESGSWCKINV